MKSKKKNIALPIILSLLAAAVVAVVVLSRRKGFKKYELTEEAKKFLQLYKADGTPLFYATNAYNVKADTKKRKNITYENGAITTHDDMVLVKAVYWDDGQKKTFAEAYTPIYNIVIETA